MALIFMDGFDHYATADIAKKWTSVSAAPAINATGGRRGGGALEIDATSEYVTKTLPQSADWVVGFAVKLSTVPASAAPILQITDSGSVQVRLEVNADGTLSVTRNGTSVTGGTSSFSLLTGTYYYVELKVTIADSIAANSCKVRVNGVDVITVATGQDLKATGNAFANGISIGRLSSVGLGTPLFDDLYVLDLTGSANNDFLGDVRVDTLFPNADGNYSAFTPSTGTTHYSLVDESTPNTTDYNDGVTIGDRDSYAFSNLTALTSQTVYGVQVNVAAMKDDAGAKSIAAFARSGSTNTDGASYALTTSQTYNCQVFALDPNTSTAWTETTINAAEFGVKVTA